MRESDGGRGGRGHGGCSGCGGGAGCGSDSDGPCAPWDSTTIGTNSSMMMMDETWKMLCNKGCGWNETHTTKYHDEQQQSAATFKVPPNHPYWLLLGKIYAAAAAEVLSLSGRGATQIPTSALMLSQ